MVAENYGTGWPGLGPVRTLCALCIKNVTILAQNLPHVSLYCLWARARPQHPDLLERLV